MILLSRCHETAPEAGKGLRLAVYQGPTEVGSADAIEANLEQLESVVKMAKARDVHVISFAELYVTGYALNPELVAQFAQPIDGPAMRRVAKIASANGIAVICPYPEKATDTGNVKFYDSIALFGPGGEILQNYRKTHLFGQAERDNFSAGDGPYEVCSINGVKLGILNCYEAEFPELSRILAIEGAKVIVIPTAADYYYTLTTGERTRVPYPDISRNLIPAHAFENHCFIAYSNRCGYEHVGAQNWHYRGNSMIASPHGELLLQARAEETLLIGDCLPGEFGPTHPEGDYLQDRRTDLYHHLVRPNVS
ncbi:MAG: carbon-nitrogen hydrolase family protein [Verrucomicrobiota bacterium]